MPDYMLLIYEDESIWAGMSEAERQVHEDNHRDFQRKLADSGVTTFSTKPLQSTDNATTVRDGIITAGPYTETSEQLGGYYVLSARDLDHALQLGKWCPTLGCVEVRPVATD